MAALATPDIFFSGEEIECLTGYKLPMRQVAWLRAKGWRFEINGNRKPIVARKYAERMLGCGAVEETVHRPNFTALRAA